MFTVEKIKYYGDRQNEADLFGKLFGGFEADGEDEPLVTHNILFNIRPRPRDPALPLAGTVFDPRRYRRP